MSSSLFDKIRLFQELQKWPLADLRTLCFYLEVEEPALDLFYDNLAGETSTDKAQSLIRHLQRFERFQSWGHLRRILEAHFTFMDATFLPPLVSDPTPTPAPPVPTAEPSVVMTTAAPRSFIGIEWQEIPAGEFWMGDNTGRNDEMPCHVVDLPTYWISKTPITNAQYRAFVQATGHRMPEHWLDEQIPYGKGNHPVVYVDWDDGIALAQWVGEQIGEMILLPSEAEWEKAARGGLVLPSGKNPLPQRKYPWGDAFDSTKCNTHQAGIGDTNPVDQYPQGASPYGVLEMSGNVREWTRSLYKLYPYVAQDGREDPASRDPRSLRGGSWANLEGPACVGFRVNADSDLTDSIIGLRLVRVPPPHTL